MIEQHESTTTLFSPSSGLLQRKKPPNRYRYAFIIFFNTFIILSFTKLRCDRISKRISLLTVKRFLVTVIVFIFTV